MKVIASKIMTYTITLIILLSGLLLAYMVLAPVDVLDNWRLTVDSNKEYPEGSTIVVTSHFDKLRSVTGISKRYVVCEASDQANVRIPVNEANADRQDSKDNNELIYLSIPQSIPSLPTRCEIEIVIEYTIYTFRKHIETMHSNSFTVIEHKEEESGSITPDNDNMVLENAPKSGVGSIKPRTVFPDTPNSTSPPQVNNTKPEDSPRTPPCPTLFVNLLIAEVCL